MTLGTIVIGAFCVLALAAILAFAIGITRQSVRAVAMAELDRAISEAKRNTAEKLAEAESDAKKAAEAIPGMSKAELEREINK